MQSFAYQQRLSEHMRAHTGERPYLCPVRACGMRFTVRCNALAHGRTRHGKSQSYRPLFLDSAMGDGEVARLLATVDENGHPLAGAAEGGVGLGLDAAGELLCRSVLPSAGAGKKRPVASSATLAAEAAAKRKRADNKVLSLFYACM